MRDDRRTLGGWLAGMTDAVRLFIYRINTKVLWVFGSVAGLVVFSASLAAIGRNTTAYGVDSSIPPSTAAQQLSRDDGTIPPADQQHTTTITQTERSTSSVSTSPRASLRVNNTPIALPQQGEVHKDIHDANGTTTVDVSIDSQSSGNSSSSSSSSVMLQSTTESITNTTVNTESGP